MEKLHYAAQRALPVDICSTFPNPSSYHPETAVGLLPRSHLFLVSAAGCDASMSAESANAN